MQRGGVVKERLLTSQYKLFSLAFSAAVFGPGSFGVTVIDGTLFTVADDLDGGGVDSEVNQEVTHGLSALLSEGQVVFGGAAFVAVAFDDDALFYALKTAGGGSESALSFRSQVILIEVEVDGRDCAASHDATVVDTGLTARAVAVGLALDYALAGDANLVIRAIGVAVTLGGSFFGSSGDTDTCLAKLISRAVQIVIALRLRRRRIRLASGY